MVTDFNYFNKMPDYVYLFNECESTTKMYHFKVKT